ncbi:two-component system response regulator [Sphingobium jiangsuense]|uniref:Response regulator NasT n=1 Tax=Sphingobium jiangsuense TaxID=870476 RepID=A0A7W6BQ37_9SPHN|nr:ANTAR domain-containing protein [Sphingobium jiangsuense]MBB3927970.1 response regulator NasT [Sphingobium jiangsuense]GLT00465.1 two-component system response regulator [Sphingobium jiangsuense]
MKIAIIDESAARAAVIEEGLREAGLDDIALLVERHGVVAELERLAPDVILINLENPSRDMLEESFALSRALARPIAMFVDQSDEASIAEAVDAGISAYVVDGLRKDRIKPVLELAVRRFHAFSRLQAELQEARSALAERKTIDRAKALLMKRRGVDEPTAYALLRKQAMDGGRRIVEVAEALITAENLLGGSL